jgi:membrane protease YdiL (CAAX protease family)
MHRLFTSTMPRINAETKAALILSAIILAEGFWLVINVLHNPSRFFLFAGFPPAGTGLLGWLVALLVAFVFVWYATKLPSVSANLFRPSWLKLLAVLLAIATAFCEECVFRKLLMDSLMRHRISTPLQVLGSALAFGIAHSVWGLMRGSVGAALRATLATGVLGLALAVVYVASHRILASCVISHFLINLFAEPGLVLAAVRGEMSPAGASAAAV